MTWLLAYAILSLAIGIASNWIGPPCPWMTWGDRVIFTLAVAVLWPVMALAVLVMLVC